MCRTCVVTGSVKPALLKVVFNDDVCDRIKHKLDVLGVRGTGEVCVNLFSVFSPVQVLKLALDVSGSLLIRVGA